MVKCQSKLVARLAPCKWACLIWTFCYFILSFILLTYLIMFYSDTFSMSSAEVKSRVNWDFGGEGRGGWSQLYRKIWMSSRSIKHSKKSSRHQKHKTHLKSFNLLLQIEWLNNFEIGQTETDNVPDNQFTSWPYSCDKVVVLKYFSFEDWILISSQEAGSNSSFLRPCLVSISGIQICNALVIAEAPAGLLYQIVLIIS